MDVCRNAAPHVGTCVVVPSSWTHDTPIFRPQEAQENQPGLCRAKLVIFAQAGQAKMAEVRTCCGSRRHQHGDVQGRTRHTDTLCATIQASAWRA